MTIFGQSRLGRLGYVLVALLMLAFDFAKTPIEKMIVRQSDAIAREMLDPRPATPEEIARFNETQNMFAPSDSEAEQRLTPHRATNIEMEQSKRLKEIGVQGKFHREMMQEFLKSGGQMTEKQLEARATQLAIRSLWDMGANFNTPPEQLERIRKHDAWLAAYPIAVLIMTGITIITLLWMISARLRDIGWPQFLLWVMIGPIFLPKLLHVALPVMAVQGITILFYGALLVLALIPGKRDEEDGTPDLAPQLLTSAPANRTAGGAPKRFGRLGNV